jgi:hypothetical protein
MSLDNGSTPVRKRKWAWLDLLCPGLGTEKVQPLDKVLPVFIVAEYFPAFYPPNHYVVQNAWSI